MDIEAVLLRGSTKQHQCSPSSSSSSATPQRLTERGFSTSCFDFMASETEIVQNRRAPSLWSWSFGHGHEAKRNKSRSSTATMSISPITTSMEPVASGASHNLDLHVTSASSSQEKGHGGCAAYFHWPPSSRFHGTVEYRASYFLGLQKDLLEDEDPPYIYPTETETETHTLTLTLNLTSVAKQQGSTLLDLMTIRAFHSKLLRQFSLGTAIGFRTRNGVLTDIPAIIVFVAHKVHKQWLNELQWIPPVLEGPGGVWCDVDVVEFSYYGTPAVAPKEQVYTELAEGLRGNDACIGPGSQVATQETCGTLGAIVQSKTGLRQVGFLTNRHVAVDLDFPNQKMFHPLPPNLGPSVYLGAVERATSFITDDLWYGIFASMNPETFVRADGAFVPFGESFDMSRVTTAVKGVGEMGEVMVVDLQEPVGSIVGKRVVKVGRSSGLTVGSIMAYALEYNDEKGVCFFTDFLIKGENKQAFDLEGDSGSLVLVKEEEEEDEQDNDNDEKSKKKKARPVGIIWGGTAYRGRLKLHHGNEPENWTSGVNLGRLLDLLQLTLITSNAALAGAVEEQRRRTAELMGCCKKMEEEKAKKGMRGGGNGSCQIIDKDYQLGETGNNNNNISAMDPPPEVPSSSTEKEEEEDSELLDFCFANCHSHDAPFSLPVFCKDAPKRPWPTHNQSCETGHNHPWP